MDDRCLHWLLVMVLVLMWTTPTRANIDPSGPTPVEERAMTFLKSLPRQWSHSLALDCKTYEDKNVERLAVPFATAAAAFLDAFQKLHGAVTITSAHRTAQYAYASGKRDHVRDGRTRSKVKMVAAWSCAVSHDISWE